MTFSDGTTIFAMVLFSELANRVINEVGDFARLTNSKKSRERAAHGTLA